MTQTQLWKCYICHIEKELSDFYKDKSRKNGYSNRCKSCDDDRHRKWEKWD